MSSIAQRIKHYRKKYGFTQMYVATELGIRADNYAKYESGARIPRADRLIKLSKILGVSYDTLNEGVERGFADMLKSHAIDIIVGDSGTFSAFTIDMQQSGEPYSVLSNFFLMGEHDFSASEPSFYEKYIARPNMTSLIELYGLYRDQCDAHPPGQADAFSLNMSYYLTRLETVIAIKWAFCIAVNKYMERTNGWTILDEAEELAANVIDTINSLQFFAIKVFIPFLSFIIDAVDLCMNTNIDDFENAFLFYARTPPDDDDLDDDDDDF